MSAPIYRESLVVHIDDDGERELVSFNAGPAGVAQVDLGDGVTVQVDFAEPSRLASIRIEPGARASTVEDLIGSQRADAVLSMVPRSDGRPRRMVGEDGPERERDQRVGPSSLARATYESMRFGRVAVLQSMVDDPWAPDLARATAALEVAVEAAGDLGDRDSIAQLGVSAVERAAQLLDGADADLSRWAGAHPDVARDLHELCDNQLLMSRPIAHAAEVLAAAGFVDHRGNAASQSSSPVPEMSGVHIELKPLGRMVVRSADLSGDQWVRVVRKESLVLLALAPMMVTASGVVAEVIVPPDLTLADMEVDITAAPLPVPASSLARVTRAVQLGRDAVALHVVGQWQRSRTRWAECARAWRELGDTTRAQIAARYADGENEPQRGPTLAERVRQTQRGG